MLRQYILECLREAPLAWRIGAIIMTVLTNAVMLGLLYLGVHLGTYPTSYFLIGTGLIAALDLIVILPFKLWKANRAEIAKLKGNYAEARKELWILRDKGVQLRNEGMTTSDFETWTEKYVTWHSEILKQASALSMDLRHSLEPVDKIGPESVETVALAIKQHQINVSVMSEMLSRLYAYLNRTTEPHSTSGIYSISLTT
jgi:hypothetical protein